MKEVGKQEIYNVRNLWYGIWRGGISQLQKHREQGALGARKC